MFLTFILIVFFIIVCLKIKINSLIFDNSDFPPLITPTTFTIIEDGNYELWATYLSVRNERVFTRQHKNYDLPPYPLKETYYNIYPFITYKKTGKQIKLESASKMHSSQRDRQSNPRFLLNNKRDYVMFLPKGTYLFERKKSNPHNYTLDLKTYTDDQKKNCKATPVTYYLKKKQPLLVIIVHNFFIVLEYILIFFLIFGILVSTFWQAYRIIIAVL